MDNDEGNNYDGVNYQLHDDIYGDVNEDIEFKTIKNPYYGGEMNDGPIAIETVQNPYYGDEVNINELTPENKASNKRNMQIVTARSNIYYEAW